MSKSIVRANIPRTPRMLQLLLRYLTARATCRCEWIYIYEAGKRYVAMNDRARKLTPMSDADLAYEISPDGSIIPSARVSRSALILAARAAGVQA